MSTGAPFDLSVVTVVREGPERLASLLADLDAQQGVDLSRVEVVAVVDGEADLDATAASTALLRSWERTTRLWLSVLEPRVSGRAAARNAGLEHVTGDRVVLLDPGDRLAPDRFARTRALVDAYPFAELVALRDPSVGSAPTLPARRTAPTTGRRADTTAPTPGVLVDLDRTPDALPDASAAPVYRRDRIEEVLLRLDPRVGRTFEHGHFLARYLLACPRPLVGLLPDDARGPADGRTSTGTSSTGTSSTGTSSTGTSSTGNSSTGTSSTGTSSSSTSSTSTSSTGTSSTSTSSTGTSSSSTSSTSTSSAGTSSTDRPATGGRSTATTTVVRNGHLDLLLRGIARSGRPPEWLQQLVLGDLVRGFPGPDGRPDLLDAVREVVGHLDPQVVEALSAPGLDPALRQVLRFGLAGAPWHSPVAVLGRVDAEQAVAMVSHRFVGPEPEVRYSVGGRTVPPTFTTLRTFEHCGRTLLAERISWLPTDGPLRVEVAGRLLELRPGWPGPATTTVVPEALDGRPRTAPAPRRPADDTPDRRPGTQARRLAARFLAMTPRGRERADDAWVLCDRVDAADDNAEHLFTYLRENRPEVNAWFAVAAGTPDHVRLSAGRHGDRVVAHGSRAWATLMAGARHVLSSSLDPAVRELPDARPDGPGRRRARFTYLPSRPVTTADRTALEAAAVDLVVTSTPGEHDLVVGPGPFTCSDKEARLLGLPRFDRLRRLARATPDADRTLVLLAPGAPLEHADPAWGTLLRSPALTATVARHGLRLGLLVPSSAGDPTDNASRAAVAADLAPGVELLTREGTGLARFVATAAVVVTDDPALTLDAAYADRPVVHLRPGRLGQQDDALTVGPVARSAEDAGHLVADVVDRGRTPEPDYLRFTERLFGARDGRCCERVVAQVEALTRPARRDDVAAGAASGTAGSRASAVAVAGQVPGARQPAPASETVVDVTAAAPLIPRQR